MGMDFSTQERVEDVDVFRIDDLVEDEFPVAPNEAEYKRESTFALISYWMKELRWRVRFWNQKRR